MSVAMVSVSEVATRAGVVGLDVISLPGVAMPNSAAPVAPEISAVVSGDGGDVAVTGARVRRGEGSRVRRGEGSSSGRVAAAGEESIVLTVDCNNAANYHARVFDQNKDTVRKQ